MGRVLPRLWDSVNWRIRRLRLALWEVREVIFWAGDGSDAAWYPDLDRLAEIGRAIGLRARQAGPEDLDLFRRYHQRVGRPLKPRRIRKMQRRWDRESACFVAFDRDDEIAAYMWVAYGDLYVEDIGRVFRVAPTDMLLYDLETRPDQRGSMGFAACACAALADGTRRGRRRIIAWSAPSQFERFRRFHWFTGLGNLKPLHLERMTRLCGLRFHRVRDVGEDWTFEQQAGAAP